MDRALSEPALLREAASHLGDLPPMGVGWLALTFGTAVESGSDPTLTGPSLVAELESWLERLPRVPDDESEEPPPEPTPRQVALQEALPNLGQAIVAHLARMPEHRLALGQDSSFLARLAAVHDASWGTTWVHEAVLRISGPLIALHATSGKGFLLRYTNVNRCFHLFSLLQTALGELLPGGQRPDPVVAAAARGKWDKPAYDSAWWHYGDPNVPKADLAGSVWGEGHVRSIPEVEGIQTLLLWPPVLKSRGWNSGFFGPSLQALPPDLEIERELLPEESRQLLQRLGIHVPAWRAHGLRKWWPF